MFPEIFPSMGYQASLYSLHGQYVARYPCSPSHAHVYRRQPATVSLETRLDYNQGNNGSRKMDE